MKHIENILIIGVAILAVVGLINLFTVLSMDSKLDTKIAQLKEASRAPSITLTTISATCDACADISPMVEIIRASHVNITKEATLDVSNAENLIAKYGIEHLPAIVIEGEIEKVSIKNFEVKDDGLLYQTQVAPYYNVRSKNVEGLVTAWVLEPSSCNECVDMNDIIAAFVGQGVAFAKTIALKEGESAATQLIIEHKITRLPALIYSDEISAYPEVLSAMAQGGFLKSGDVHVYESRLPYYNLSSKQVQGLVDITYLSDSTCTECYDVQIHKGILERYGMGIGDEATLDVSSSLGKAILAKYAITSVPTVVLKGDTALYTGFDMVWGTVGTIEKDGSYVFRNNTVFSGQFGYKDIKTGEVIQPIQPQQQLT